MKRRFKIKKVVEDKTDFTPFVNKEVKKWEKKHGKVKYSKKFCKEHKVTKEKNKL
jgi:hypothetical protein